MFSILINAYLIHYNRPKKHEIEKNTKRIAFENTQVDGIKAEGVRSRHALMHSAKSNELEAQIAHLAEMKEQARAELQKVEAKKANAEDNLKLMTGHICCCSFR